MNSYIYFALFCISFYFALDFTWVGIFCLCFGYAWMISLEQSMNKSQEKEKTRSLSEKLEEANKQGKRKFFLWNFFGWSILIFLVFFSPENAVLFFLFGAFFFNWGIDFLFTPLKNLFGCECKKDQN